MLGGYPEQEEGVFLAGTYSQAAFKAALGERTVTGRALGRGYLSRALVAWRSAVVQNRRSSPGNVTLARRSARNYSQVVNQLHVA